MRILLRPPPQLSRKSSNWFRSNKNKRHHFVIVCRCNMSLRDVVTRSAEWSVGVLILTGRYILGLTEIFSCPLAGATLHHHQQQHHHRPYVIEAPRITAVCADVGTARSRSHYKFLIPITSASSYIVIGEVGGTWWSPAEHIAQPAAGPWSASLLCELLTWGPSSR